MTGLLAATAGKAASQATEGDASRHGHQASAASNPLAIHRKPATVLAYLLPDTKCGSRWRAVRWDDHG